MQRELATFPLNNAMKSKLSSAGFSTVEDVVSFKPSELSKVLRIEASEALELQQSLRVDIKPSPSTSSSSLLSSSVHTLTKATAWDLMQSVQRPIVTFCEALDDLLGGGVPCGKMTEFAGAPGVGKTQLCIQLAVDVQIPACFDGLEGEALYIDTEGSFIVERVIDIATATSQHCRYMATIDADPSNLAAADKFTVNSILEGIHYIRCHDHIELIATIQTVDAFVRSHPRIMVVIIDSIAFPFRWDCDDFALRSRLLNSAAQTLSKAAATHGLAVVLTNQMTTRFGAVGGSQLIPALGESWGHSCSIRVVLRWEGEQRRALIYKSPSCREAEVSYQITTGGVRDLQGK